MIMKEENHIIYRTKVVMSEVNSENLEWLQRSIVGFQFVKYGMLVHINSLQPFLPKKI